MTTPVWDELKVACDAPRLTREGPRVQGVVGKHASPGGIGAVQCPVADEPEQPAGTVEDDSLSPAERVGNAFSDWLHDRPRRRRRRFEPVEIALFSVIAGVTLIIVAGLVAAFTNFWSAGAWTLIGVTTQWAQLPIAAVLLGACLLASYQNRRACDELGSCLNQDETYEGEREELSAEVEQTMTSLVRHLNRARVALACIAVLGLLTATAAVAELVGAIHTLPGFIERPRWWGYIAFVAGSLAVIIPALACVVIAPRGWVRGSDLLSGNDADAPFEDEPEHPAEPQAVS